MATYCTYFDHRYVPRGIAMIDSLLAYTPDSDVWVLALNDLALELIQARYDDRVKLVAIVDFEDAMSPIADLRARRSPVEYIFTCTAAWVRYVMDATSRKGELVTYLDADLWFFGSPEALEKSLDGSSVAITPHRYPRTLRRHEKYGVYNVGWVSFRDDERGRTCLHWWDDSCRRWCFDRVEGTLFADQGYLNDFGKVTDGVMVIDDPGANLAPWNLASHRLTSDGQTVRVDGSPLLFFHFHGITRSGGRFYVKHLQYHARSTSLIRDEIYQPYLQSLTAVERDLKNHAAMGPADSSRDVPALWKRAVARAGGDSLTLP